MYLCHNLNGDATQQIDARRRRGLVVADRVRTVTFSAGGLSSFDICSRRRRHPSQSHACTMAARCARAERGSRQVFAIGGEKAREVTGALLRRPVAVLTKLGLCRYILATTRVATRLIAQLRTRTGYAHTYNTKSDNHDTRSRSRSPGSAKECRDAP